MRFSKKAYLQETGIKGSDVALYSRWVDELNGVEVHRGIDGIYTDESEMYQFKDSWVVDDSDCCQVYIAGDMLKEGSRLLRTRERKQITDLGLRVYNPMDNKEINDKSSQTEESNKCLCDKIVAQDTKAIRESDIIVIEPTDGALGTMVELGQIKGMRDISKDVLDVLWEDISDKEKIDKVWDLCYSIIHKEVYPHYEDCRRTNIPEVGDTRSWSVNQYVYGVCKELSNGKGFYEWDEVLKALGE